MSASAQTLSEQGVFGRLGYRQGRITARVGVGRDDASVQSAGEDFFLPYDERLARQAVLKLRQYQSRCRRRRKLILL